MGGLLEDQQVMECVDCLIPYGAFAHEYAPRINPQQLKNALISRPECDRVERMIQGMASFAQQSLCPQ